MIIKENDEEELEFVEEIKDKNGFQLIFRLLQYVFSSSYNFIKKSKIILILVAFILLYMNKHHLKNMVMKMLFKLR